MDENARYEKLKKVLGEWEIHILFEFYDNFSNFIEEDYCKNRLKKAKSNDERLMAYLQLLAIYLSITFAKVRRWIEEKIIDYDHELYLDFIESLPLIKDKLKDRTEKPSEKTPETYTF